MATESGHDPAPPVLPATAHPGKAAAFEAGQLEAVLVQLGCPAAKAGEMAGMLVKRSAQLAEQKGCSQATALAHLLSLMKKGWAAQERGIG